MGRASTSTGLPFANTVDRTRLMPPMMLGARCAPARCVLESLRNRTESVVTSRWLAWSQASQNGNTSGAQTVTAPRFAVLQSAVQCDLSLISTVRPSGSWNRTRQPHGICSCRVTGDTPLLAIALTTESKEST